MKSLAFFILTCAAVPSHWCAPIIEEDSDVRGEESLNGVHGHADLYRDGRDFNNNAFDVGDIVVSGHVKGEDVSVGSRIDIQVEASISKSLPMVEVSKSLKLPAADVSESYHTEDVWESLHIEDISESFYTEVVLKPLHTVAMAGLPLGQGSHLSFSSGVGDSSSDPCDPDACKTKFSVAAGVCTAVAGFGGAAVATTCVITGWFTAGISCAVAWAAVGAGCKLVDVVGPLSCDACPSDAELNLQQIAIDKMDQMIRNTKDLENNIDLTQILSLYGQDLKRILYVRDDLFNLLNRGASGIIENDKAATDFHDAALHVSEGLRYSIHNIFLMLIGGLIMRPESIYELKHFCKSEVHQYFLDIQMEALIMMTTALAMQGDPLQPKYNKDFNQKLVKATSAYVRHCGCPDGFTRSNRGKISDLLDFFSPSNESLGKNRRNVIVMEDKAMRLKMHRILEIQNFELNNLAMNILREHSVEDIDLVVDIIKNKTKTDIKFHDNANICVNEELNEVVRTILIESTGAAAEYVGGGMGYFDRTREWFNRRPVFKQRGGDEILYYNEKLGRWQVGDEEKTWVKLIAISNDPEPVSTGWKYTDGDEYRDDDSSLKLINNPEDPSSSCNTIRVTALGPAAHEHGEVMGKYKWNGEWLNGHKLFNGGKTKMCSGSKKGTRCEDSECYRESGDWGDTWCYKVGGGWGGPCVDCENGDQYLRVVGATWSIHSSKNGNKAVISSGRATTCPCQVEAAKSRRFSQSWWQYSDNGWWTDMSIQVTCHV